MTDVIFSPVNPDSDFFVRISYERELPLSTINTLQRAAVNNRVEVCGFIDTSYRIHFITNQHEDPAHNFIMDQDEVRRTIERIVVANEKILGVFHTHPSGHGRPSANDIEGWPNKDLGWRYFIATSSDVYDWEAVNQPVHKSHMAGIPVRR